MSTLFAGSGRFESVATIPILAAIAAIPVKRFYTRVFDSGPTSALLPAAPMIDSAAERVAAG